MSAEWITIRDASRLLGVSERSVRRYIKRYDWESKLDTLSGSSVNQRFVRKSDVINHMEEQGGGQRPTSAGGGVSSDGMPVPASEMRDGLQRVAEAFERTAEATEGQAERMEEMSRIERKREEELLSRVEEAMSDEPKRPGAWARLYNGLIWGLGFGAGLLALYGIVLAVLVAGG